MIDFHDQFETTGWEAYAEDFDFELPTIEEEYYVPNENSQVQEFIEHVAQPNAEHAENHDASCEFQDANYYEQDAPIFVQRSVPATGTEELPTIAPKEEPVELAETPLF
jgi:hypothetical protein